MAHGAAQAIGADEVAGAEVGLAVAAAFLGSLHLGGHPVVVLPQAHQLRLVAELHPRLPRPAFQEVLHLVLRCHQQIREARGQAVEVEGEVAERAHPVDHRAGGDQLVRQASGVEQLQRAGVDTEGARHRARTARAALYEGDAQARRREVPGEQQAGRARAHDENIDGNGVGGAVHSDLLGCQRLLVNACWQM